MSNQFKTAVIEDFTSYGISEAEQSNLLDIFEYAMKSIAATLAREAKFDTSDFATAKQRGCEGFTFWVRRARAHERNTWQGEFSKGNQHLTVLGSLE